MSSVTLSTAERECFLADRHVGVIGIERPGRAPVTVPIWYAYSPGGEVEIWTEPGSLKARLLKQAGRFSLCAQNEERPYRYATAEGPITEWIEPAPRERAEAIAARYLAEPELSAYVDAAHAEPSLLVRMRPERWSSYDETRAWTAPA
jgi:nitroimidazol reductase NimA-like FMN-containing flavoprotein (pyridoxamine 5'-phosphate oxidase superfamily)